MPRNRNSERAFTLFELLVVMLILGILVAVGIPMFAGIRHASELATAEQEIAAALNRARWMAISSGRWQTTVQLASCSGTVCTALQILDEPDGTVLSEAHVSGYGATLAEENLPFSLDNRGFLRTPANIPSLTVTSTKLGITKTLSVTPVGKVRSS